MAVLPPGFERERPILTDELGVTYAAVRSEPGQQQDVALRLLSVRVPGRPARRQFRGSCLAVTAITGQPGVLATREVLFTSESQPCLVTDLYDRTLADQLADGPLPASEALDVAAALARTLAGAHEAGIVHLDVRPANVVTAAGRPGPLLAYFGVSRAIGAADNAELPVECLLHAGRELFGWDIPGPAADVHALASTLHATLAGQAPYAAEARMGRAALYQRVLRGGPPPVTRPGIPASVGPLIAAMMDPNPASRPALSEVIAVLDAAAANSAPLTGHTASPATMAEPGSVRLTSQAGSVSRPEPASAASSAPRPAPAAQWAPVASALATDLAVPANPGSGAVGAARPGLPSASRPVLGAEATHQPGALMSADSVAPATAAPPVDLTAPPTAGHPHPRQHRPAQRRPTGLLLLVAAGLLALLAGVVWGVVTAPAPRPPRGGPTVRATASAKPVNPAKLAAYRPTSVQALVRAGAIVVQWAAPVNVHGVTAYLVVAESGGSARQERTVALAARRAVFAGLAGGQRYCFVVGALIEPAGGQARTAAARPVCAIARRARR